MKLSELIIKGQTQGKAKSGHTTLARDKNGYYACPLGMAGLALGLSCNQDDIVSIGLVLPTIYNAGIDISQSMVHPVTNKKAQLQVIVMSLFDFHHWTVDAIVKWLQENSL